MSNLKCPFCGEKIEHIEDGWCNCKNRCTGSGSIELWLQFLRTRKALDVAVRAIETIKYSKKSDAINLRHKANKALIEIYKIKDQTALEQKEVK